MNHPIILGSAFFRLIQTENGHKIIAASSSVLLGLALDMEDISKFAFQLSPSIKRPFAGKPLLIQLAGPLSQR